MEQLTGDHKDTDAFFSEGYLLVLIKRDWMWWKLSFSSKRPADRMCNEADMSGITSLIVYNNNVCLRNN